MRAVHIAGVVDGKVESVDPDRGRVSVAFRIYGKNLKRPVPISDVLPR